MEFRTESGHYLETLSDAKRYANKANQPQTICELAPGCFTFRNATEMPTGWLKRILTVLPQPTR